ASRQPARNRLDRRACVRGAQRMIPAFGLWHDCVGLTGERGQKGQKWRRHIRHVARHDDRHVGLRFRERSMQAAQWPRARRQIRNAPDETLNTTADALMWRVAADDEDFTGDLRQLGYLAFG